MIPTKPTGVASRSWPDKSQSLRNQVNDSNYIVAAETGELFPASQSLRNQVNDSKEAVKLIVVQVGSQSLRNQVNDSNLAEADAFLSASAESQSLRNQVNDSNLRPFGGAGPSDSVAIPS